MAPLYASVDLSKKKTKRSDNKSVIKVRSTSQRINKNDPDTCEKHKDVHQIQIASDSSGPCLSTMDPGKQGSVGATAELSNSQNVYDMPFSTLGPKQNYRDFKLVANRRQQVAGPSFASVNVSVEKKKRVPKAYYEEVQLDPIFPNSVDGVGARKQVKNPKRDVGVYFSSQHSGFHRAGECQSRCAKTINSVASVTDSGPVESDGTLEEGISDRVEQQMSTPEHSSKCFTFSMAVMVLLMTSIAATLVAFLSACVIIYQLHNIESFAEVKEVQVSSSRLSSCSNYSKCLHSVADLNSSIEFLLNKNFKQDLDHYNSIGIISPLFDSCLSLSMLFYRPPSGYYWMAAHNGTPVNVFCEMASGCGNNSGGWTRLIKWNSGTPGAHCSWKENNNGGSFPQDAACLNMSSQFGLEENISYSKVCVKIQAYFTNNSSIASGCADRRISITSDSLDMPIWTFSRNHSTEQSASGTRCNNCYYRVVSREETDLDMPSNVICNDSTTTLLKNLTQPILKNIKVQVVGTALVLRAIELYLQ